MTSSICCAYKPPYLLAALACLLCLASCASQPPAIERRPPSVIVDGLDIAMMAHVVKYGFSEIDERAFEKPSIDNLFLHVLDGLSDIDPQTSFEADSHRILVRYDGAPLPPFIRPPENDINEWTRTTLKVILTLRQVSPLMKTADDESFYKAIFTAALHELDPYSRYSGRTDAIRSRLVRDGTQGIGVGVIPAHDGAMIQALVRNGPADKAGLMLDDIITYVDGVDLSDLTAVEAQRRIDGRSGTTAQLIVIRKDAPRPLSFAVRRGLFLPNTVTSRIVGDVLEIKISSFNQRTAQSVENAVLEAAEQKAIKGIVLDLRGDPGGLLDQAVDIADLFMETGTIITLRGRHPGSQQYYAARRGDIAEGRPITVIVDGRAASASEIVAIALQDNQRAAVVGTVSLGKGSVQTVIRLPNQGEIALTWSHAYTPRGASLHGLGVLPDVCLSGTDLTFSGTMGRIYSGADLPPEIRAGWQSPPSSPTELEALRSACHPETHPDRAIDMEVARKLVEDPILFARATLGRTRQLAEKH